MTRTCRFPISGAKHDRSQPLSGRAPDRASALICGQPDPIRPINSSDLPIPADFAAPLVQALALDPAQRPACATDLRAALAEARPEHTEKQAALPAKVTAALPRLPEAAPVTIVEPAILNRPEKGTFEAAAPLAHPREGGATGLEAPPQRLRARGNQYRVLLVTLLVLAVLVWSRDISLFLQGVSTGWASPFLLSEPIRYFQKDGGLYKGAVRFSPDGQMIATAISEKSVQLWRTTDGGDICKVRLGEQTWRLDIAFSPNSEILFTNAGSAGVQLWNTSDCSLQRTFADVQSTQGEFALAPNGEMFAHVGDSSVDFAPDGRTIIAGFVMGTVKVWRVN